MCRLILRVLKSGISVCALPDFANLYFVRQLKAYLAYKPKLKAGGFISMAAMLTQSLHGLAVFNLFCLAELDYCLTVQHAAVSYDE